MLRAYVRHNLDDIAESFKTKAGRARRTDRVAQKIAKRLGEIAVDRIETKKRDPWGKPWTPWSDGYAETRRAGHSLLMDTPQLIRSFIVRYTDKSAVVENFDPKAGYVQAKRSFLGVGPAEREAVEEVAEDWLRRLIRE